jgi:NADP-dependent 3-hydroxy acid dehydrogenase YdfG
MLEDVGRRAAGERLSREPSRNLSAGAAPCGRRACPATVGIMLEMRVSTSVALTGACGRIGSALARHLAARDYQLTLIDRPGAGLGEMASLGNVVELDLRHRPSGGLFGGVEVVVHLAGEANENAPWDRLLPDNIEASYNVALAAMQARCRRLIVASSVHAVLAAARRPVTPRDPVAPADLYGVTKCFVEALAFWCAHRGGMSAAAVRIGAFQPVEASRARDARWMADMFIAEPDLLSLLELAIDAEYHFAILHAAAPGGDVLLDPSMTENLLGWRAEHRFPLTADS